jgi:hypothetical protein
MKSFVASTMVEMYTGSIPAGRDFAAELIEEIEDETDFVYCGVRPRIWSPKIEPGSVGKKHGELTILP